MSGKRIVYQNWIVDIGRDPSLPQEEIVAQVEASDAYELRSRVREAIQSLDEKERELIEQVYFLGQSFRSVSDATGRAVYKLEALHRRAFRKLRNNLTTFVRTRFQLDDIAGEEDCDSCAICSSLLRVDIERLIAGRSRVETWRPLMKCLRSDFGLDIRSPQILISHEKYHMGGETSPSS